MTTVLEQISTITSKGQTTVPKPVRDALGLAGGDRLAFRVGEAGVTLHRVDQDQDDPAIDAFLSFLAKDMQCRPGAMSALNPALAERIGALVEGIDIDQDSTIEGAVDL